MHMLLKGFKGKEHVWTHFWEIKSKKWEEEHFEQAPVIEFQEEHVICQQMVWPLSRGVRVKPCSQMVQIGKRELSKLH